MCLVGRACSRRMLFALDGYDTIHRATRQSAQGELRVFSHARDYRYDDLKNTEQELQSQEEAFTWSFFKS